MTKTTRTVLVALLGVAAMAPARVEAQGGQLLGQRVVSFRSETDVIPVTAAQGAFRRVQVRVQGNAIHLGNLRVHFRNGTFFDAPVRAVIGGGSQTRWIDLPGDARIIHEVRFDYQTIGRGRRGRATVSLWGDGPWTAPAGGVAAPEARRPPVVVTVQNQSQAGIAEAPAELLGRRVVDFRAEQDVIPVTVARGVFRRIQLRVQGNDVEIGDVTVTFGNGTTFAAAVRQVLRGGGQTRWIDLPGDQRVIRDVRLTYRTLGRVRRGRATVDLYGQRDAAPGTVVVQPSAPTSATVVVQPSHGPTQATVVVQPSAPTSGTVVVQPNAPTSATVVVQPNAGWAQLGQRMVDLRAERDVIPVTAARGAFRRIKIRVDGNAVHFFDVHVRYGNGSVHPVRIRQVIPAGGETRAIDLPGDARFIQAIELVYRSGPVRQGRATVTVLGQP